MATNYELLSDAQEYLKDQISGIAPNSELLNSWDEFFAVYDAIIRRFAVAVGVAADEVDECVQDVWTAVVAHLNRFHPDPERGRFRTWLYHIVRSKSTDLVRRRARGAALSLNDSRYEFDVAGTTDGDEDDSQTTLEQRWQQQSLAVSPGGFEETGVSDQLQRSLS